MPNTFWHSFVSFPLNSGLWLGFNVVNRSHDLLQNVTLSQLELRLVRNMKLKASVSILYFSPSVLSPFDLIQFCFPSHLVISSCIVYRTSSFSAYNLHHLLIFPCFLSACVLKMYHNLHEHFACFQFCFFRVWLRMKHIW